ncbi:efflux RND transporter periplasmic adaptor subunit [Paucibacter sp. DJ2R-2]|uniref:efflux RND transporter periplasmic adaptor subunit n=1 Tax=Paucibacter sp. DJ2R-2 TaxID=2893558 RepID=UPI0021E39578|nr:efflux RND transporter periplasmic adaptor subunit [Paucibacter sp. DJ2R-2]MCV2422610.1 efflux RND transporter periplasmic adaptor subunit [Paucibacter sp. DJ4R-1]MCV2438808.1 efflux RND transporter periplasmic adaptor subunit [Paucibacter sp. DJ2R-2]
MLPSQLQAPDALNPARDALRTRALYVLPLVIAVAAALTACGGGDKAGAGPAGGGMPPPAPVGVVKTELQAVGLQTELPGRVEAQRTAQVRARANGVVLKRLFTEGSEIKAGQVLFQIDPAPYQAALDSAQASLAKAQANLAQAAAQAERNKPLVEARAISQQEYLSSVAAAKAAEADVAAGKAAVQSAKLNLGYAAVTAPISGRIGRALVTEGALVSAAEATQLALVQQTSSVYVNFTQSANEVQQLRRALAGGKLRSAGAQAAQVRIVLDDGSELAKPGRLLFTDLSVDAASGQVSLRAEVPNAEGQLLPGQYVRVRLSQGELPAGILLPQQAVKRSNQGDSVLVVGAGNKPEPRMVKVGSAQGNQWVVLDGLKPGEQVIVDGFQKMFVPGAPVTPVPWSAASASAPAAPAAPASAASR